MSLWNQYSFSPTGLPIAPSAPAALRVMDGQATAEQFAMAQKTFHQFVTGARLSPVPNPTEIGRLPDGSRYKINVVGTVATMELWVSGKDDNLRDSGVVLCLSYLDGSLPPEHADETGTGFAIYLLTPQVKKSTRIPTGKWIVRKRRTASGGKAVHAGKSGLKYYTAVSGKADDLLPLFRDGNYGVNGQAYRSEVYSADEAIYYRSKQYARSVSNATPIPFVLTAKDGKSLGMQMNFGYDEIAGQLHQYIDLLVGPFEKGGVNLVGDVSFREIMPYGQNLDYRTITFSANGQKARVSGSTPGSMASFDIEIYQDQNKVYRSATKVHASGNEQLISGHFDNQSFKQVESGQPNSPSYRVEVWTIAGVPSDDPTYGGTTAANGSPFSDGYGEFTTYVFAIGDYSFDRRGVPMDELGLRTSKSVSARSETRTVDSYRHFESETLDRRKETVNSPSGSQVVLDTYETKLIVNDVDDDGVVTSVVTGGGRYYKNNASGAFPPWGGSQLPLFADHQLDFAVYYDVVDASESEWSWTTEGKTILYDRLVKSLTLTVRCKGVKALVQPADFNSDFRHIVFLASDPMTGALVVSVQEIHQITRSATKSWIFLVDDTGAQLLQNTMKSVAPGTHIKVRRNADLLSV